MGLHSGFGGQPPYQSDPDGGKWQEIRDMLDKLPIDPKDTPKNRYTWGWVEVPKADANRARISANGYSKRRGAEEGWAARTTIRYDGVANGFVRLWLRRIERQSTE